jgi:hypothetical protein
MLNNEFGVQGVFRVELDVDPGNNSGAIKGGSAGGGYEGLMKTLTVVRVFFY